MGLAQAGAAVVVLARNEEKNQRVLGELPALGVRALAVRVNVTERGQLQPAHRRRKKWSAISLPLLRSKKPCIRRSNESRVVPVSASS
jgi:NADP-dependent 3-hydroxy acid dehydrogenase YdfG